MSDHLFRQAGLGYVLELPSIFTTFSLERISKSRDGIHGDLLVKSAWPAAKTVNGVMYGAQFNVSAGATRKSVASTLAARSPVAKEEDQLDWYGFLEEFCQNVMKAEREGSPIEEIGLLPDSERPPALLAPILDRDQATLLYGDSGTGKSMLALAMGVSVKTGAPVVPGFTPSGRGEVLYLDYETSLTELDRRLKAICAGAGIARTSILYRRCFSPLHEIAENIARETQDRNVALVIIDPIGYAMGFQRDGGDPAEPALRLFGALRLIGGTALGVDHVGKNGTGTGPSKPYGSSYKAHAARATWELKTASEPEGQTNHIAIYHQKHNNTRKFPAMGFAVNASDDFVSFESEEIFDPALSESMTNGDRIEALLRSVAHPLRPGEIAAQTGMAENLIRSELNRLKGKRFDKIETGDWKIIEGGA